MKIIGIITRKYYNKDNQLIYQINNNIIKRIEKYNNIIYIAILPPNTKNTLTTKDKIKLNKILDICDAFISPGGSYWYKYDEYIIKYAIKKDKPLLAICLGFQALSTIYTKNRYKLDMTIKNNNHNSKKHIIYIKDNTLLKRILNKNKIKVNSYHKTHISRKIKKLKISAISKDGIIEAVEYPNKRFILGLQWHPEYLKDNNSKKIFNYFIKTIKKGL